MQRARAQTSLVKPNCVWIPGNLQIKAVAGLYGLVIAFDISNKTQNGTCLKRLIAPLEEQIVYLILEGLCIKGTINLNTKRQPRCHLARNQK